MTHFPAVELPSLFGLHENAELSYQKSESNSILQNVLLMMPNDQSSEGTTVQEIDNKVLSKIQDIIKILPEQLQAASVKMKFNIILANGKEMPSPYASVLRQECARYNKLLTRIKQLFNDTQLAI